MLNLFVLFRKFCFASFLLHSFLFTLDASMRWWCLDDVLAWLRCVLCLPRLLHFICVYGSSHFTFAYDFLAFHYIWEIHIKTLNTFCFDDTPHILAHIPNELIVALLLLYILNDAVKHMWSGWCYSSFIRYVSLFVFCAKL